MHNARSQWPTCIYPQAFSIPDSDAYNPRYGVQMPFGGGRDVFDNAAATLLLTVINHATF
jgi:hypothetical protein